MWVAGHPSIRVRSVAHQPQVGLTGGMQRQFLPARAVALAKSEIAAWAELRGGISEAAEKLLQRSNRRTDPCHGEVKGGIGDVSLELRQLGRHLVVSEQTLP